MISSFLTATHAVKIQDYEKQVFLPILKQVNKTSFIKIINEKKILAVCMSNRAYYLFNLYKKISIL